MQKIIIAFLLLCGVCLCAAVPKFTPAITPVRDYAFSKDLLNMGQSNSCNKTTSCAGKGAACSGTFGGTSNCSSNSSGTPNCCALGLYCINSKCATNNMGSSCSNTSQCMASGTAGLPYSCVGGICTYLSLPNDACSNNSQCAFGLPCNNSVCTAPGLNQNCSSNGLCGYGLYCGLANNSLICMAEGTSNSTCETGKPCNPAYICIAGKCQSTYSVGAGGNCFGRSDYCNTGYVCDAVNATCVSAQTSLPTCTATSNCSSGQVCLCSEFSGKQFCVGGDLDPCTSQAQSLYSCLNDHNCSTAGDAPNACCYENCYSSFKKAMGCDCSDQTSFYGNCAYNAYCGGFPIWAIIVIIIVIVILILAVVLIVFIMMRRRRQYDTI